MRSRRSECARGAGVVSLATALLSPLVHAQPAAADEATPITGVEDEATAEAREAFRNATDLARRARWLEALAELSRSYALRPHPITTYNIAYCERAIGHYTRALQLFAKSLMEHAAGDKGQLPAELLEKAHAQLRQLAQQVARVQVHVVPNDALILVDGRPLERAHASVEQRVVLAGVSDPGPATRAPDPRFELWLDPGSHVFVLARPGEAERVVTAQLSAGDNPALELVARQEPRTARTAPQPKPETKADTGSRTWAYIAFGAGAAGVVVGSVAGVAALRKRSTLLDECGGERVDCPPNRQTDIEALNTYADVATFGFVAGAVGLGIGTVLILTEEKRTPSAAVVLSPGSVQARMRF